MPTSNDFEEALLNEFEKARRLGLTEVRITSGALHRIVGDYPGNNHRMPICCSVMRKKMNPGDEIIQQPPKGNGACLIIRYHLQSNI